MRAEYDKQYKQMKRKYNTVQLKHLKYENTKTS